MFGDYGQVSPLNVPFWHVSAAFNSLQAAQLTSEVRSEQKQERSSAGAVACSLGCVQRGRGGMEGGNTRPLSVCSTPRMAFP